MIAEELLNLANRVGQLEKELHEAQRDNRFLKLRLRKLEAEGAKSSDEIPPWEVLGVAADASAEEIQTAFRRLSKQLHPDAPEGDRDAFERLVSAKSVMLANVA